MDAGALLRAYDDQLRTDAETYSAVEVSELGPLRLATMSGGRGFITYRDLSGADAAGIGELVEGALAHFRDDTDVAGVEWKTRGHDRAPGLHEALVAHGFEPEDVESVMLGEAAGLAVDVELPDGVALRQLTGDDEDEVRAACRLQDEVFGSPPSDTHFHGTLRSLRSNAGGELWVAEAGDEMISAGRLEPVANSDFAGIWGGVTREQWRGRGIYRALTAARARSALRLGKTLIHSDSTEYSRPILERSGLVKVTTTTPYQWKRAEPTHT